MNNEKDIVYDVGLQRYKIRKSGGCDKDSIHLDYNRQVFKLPSVLRQIKVNCRC